MRVGVIGHTGYDDLPDILDLLLRLAPELDFDLEFEDEMHKAALGGARLTDPKSIDALVTLGGDGTLLRGARLLDGAQAPILGINLGRVGFLTTCGSDEIEVALRSLAARTYIAECNGSSRNRCRWKGCKPPGMESAQ